MKFEPPVNSNYAAVVVRISRLVRLDGLDNLVGVPVLGHQALTQKGKSEGDLVIAFTAETQLSDEFAAFNNLYRSEELNNDKTERGYLEANRRIRAIKLRGHRSDALIMPLSSVEFATKDWLDLEEGDTFDTINGHEICCKYEIPVKRLSTSAQSKITKAFKRVDRKLFPEHLETSQYHREKHLLKPGREVVITQKLHGCFPSKAKVTMWDGSQKRISQIVVGDIVCGFDHVTGSFVPSAVKKVAVTGTTDKWTVTKVRYPLRGDDAGIFSTPDHQIFTENRGYVEASELRTSDVVKYERYLPEITDAKRDILEGMLLGDGSFAYTGANYAIAWGIKDAHLPALEYRQHLLGNLCTMTQRARTSGYGTRMIDASTVRHPEINDLAIRWRHTPRVGKRVPDDLTLSDWTIATFYMDDGSLAHNAQQCQRDRALFAICDWDDESAENIRQAFVRWGVKNPVIYKPDGYNRMRLNADDARFMFERIADLLPSAMAYKLPEDMRYRARGLATLPDASGSVAVRGNVVSVSHRSAQELGYATKYDIETETHNFFANHVLVHNSSIRVGNVPCLRKKGRIERFLNRWIPTAEYEYDMVYGSRKVIKDVNNPGQQHFYGADLWTEVGKRLDGLIPEGYLVYAEIVGWAKNAEGEDIPIQKGYTYDQPKGQCELFVYRVAQVNAQGTLADLAWDGVKEFCQERGLKWVPELYRDIPEFIESEVIEPYLDTAFWLDPDGWWDEAPVPLSDKKTVDEGFCLRQEGIVPLILKAKSPIFLQHESKMLDEEVVDLESVA